MMSLTFNQKIQEKPSKKLLFEYCMLGASPLAANAAIGGREGLRSSLPTTSCSFAKIQEITPDKVVLYIFLKSYKKWVIGYQSFHIFS